ncbi:Oidioi.mRNA.OKI2018_I69.chr1.g2697.t1.cds [Oikopleura dioica]|uniref:Oidioi.mRNA.OKI2018_I69.chr1.g2697.t1.cds n=1 Tax=Oikopleura dioica TaxID=34765 RepID=A0ABN7SVE8_OIKDI|nr:Oidioi.mRNA.OKI2018_I69.chr1.g2697.t1.cds [Oikopleura dioica]
MGLLKLLPTSVLEGMNDAGAYYYACYLCINISAYVPVALLTSVAVRHPRVATHVQNRCRMKIQNAQKSANSPTLNPFKKKLAQRAEKKYQKLLTLAEDDAKKFYFGIMLGLFLNETILMPPQLILAYPMTTPFKKLVQMVPQIDEPLTSVSDWCLESVRGEIKRRELKRLAKLAKINGESAI